MKYLWKSLLLVLDLALMAVGAVVFTNGIFIISNVLGNTSFKPFFLYHLPLNETFGFGNFDWTVFSDLAVSIICIAIGLAILYRAIIAFIEGVQFFNSDFFVIRKGKIKLSPEEMTYSELLPSHIKDKGGKPKSKSKSADNLISRFPKFFPTKSKVKESQKTPGVSEEEIGLPTEPIIKPEAIGDKLNENVEILKQKPLETPPETPIDEIETEPTKQLQTESAPFENFTSSLITPKEQKATKQKEEEEKERAKEEIAKAKIEEAEKEKKLKPPDYESNFLGEVVAKTPEDEAKIEEEFLRSLNVASLWRMLWHRKHKAPKTPGTSQTPGAPKAPEQEEKVLHMNIK